MNFKFDKQIIEQMKQTKSYLEGWVKLIYTQNTKDDAIFDYRGIPRKSILDDNCTIINEYSSKYFVSRTIYIYTDRPNVCYWSCCNSKNPKHDPLIHKEEIYCVSKSD